MTITKPLSFALILLLIATSYGRAHIIDPETGAEFEYKAQLVEVAPVIDGFIDDPAWKEAISGSIKQDVLAGGRWRESDDFKGTFAAVWRNGYLYLAIQISDNYVETHHEKLSRQDHLIIYLDIDHSGHKSEFYRHIIPVGTDDSLHGQPPIMIAWGHDGLSCELSINLGRPIGKQEVIGFGVYYNDVDQGRLTHRFGWGPVGHTEAEEFLADLVFTARLKRNENQKTMQWGGIKELF